MSDYIIGVDIGSSNIYTAAGKLDIKGNMQIIALTSVNCQGVKKGIIIDLDETSLCIKNCIEKLEGMLDTKINEVYASIPGGLTEIVQSKGIVAVSSEDKEIRKNDIDRVIKAAKKINISSDKEIVDIIPEQYIIDDYCDIKDPLGMSGSRLEMDADIVLAKTTVINNIYKCSNKAGIKINSIVFAPQAVAELVLKRDEAEFGTAIVDVGSDLTNISIYKKGILCFSDVLNFGGSIITNDIAVCLKLPFSEAERIKIKHSEINNKNDDNIKIRANSNYNNKIDVDSTILNEIIQARIEEIIQFILSKIKGSGYYEELSGLVFVGGGLSKFKGIEEISMKILKKPVRIADVQYAGSSNAEYAGVIGIIHNYLRFLKVNITDTKLNENVESKIWHDSETDEELYEDEEHSILGKIKEFFTDFF